MKAMKMKWAFCVVNQRGASIWRGASILRYDRKFHELQSVELGRRKYACPLHDAATFSITSRDCSALLLTPK